MLELALTGRPVREWYDELFQELCHQYTVSEVAYAAVPHLVEIAEKTNAFRKQLLVLIGSCYAFSLPSDTPSIPQEAKEDWVSGAKRTIPLLGQALAEPDLESSDLRYLLFATAAVHGYPSLAHYIERFDVEIECPNCGYLIDPSTPEELHNPPE